MSVDLCSSSQREGARCPICWDGMCTEGDHQTAALECGHIFGFRCITEWLNSETGNELCPTCRKRCDPSKTIRVVWDGGFPVDSGRFDELQAAEVKLTEQRRKLIAWIAELQRDLIICDGELARTRWNKREVVVKCEIVKTAVTRPSILMESKVRNARRICMTPRFLTVVCQDDESDKYGIKVWDHGDLTRCSFTAISDSVIWDIALSPYDQQVVATVSVDRHLIVTSLRTGRSTVDCVLPVPLMSCEWIDRNTVACGGYRGRVFLVDGAGQVLWETALGDAPPVVAISRITDHLAMIATSFSSRILDVAARDFQSDVYSSGRCISRHNDDFVTVSRENAIELCTFTDHKWLVNTEIQLKKYGNHARPGIARINGRLICAIPDEDRCDFLLYADDALDVDLWSDYRKIVPDAAHPTPIMDISIRHDVDVIVTCLSCSCVKVVALPIT